MGAFDNYYATQPSAHDDYHALEAEARARGMLMIEVEKEHRLAERERLQAEQARVQALLDDPATVCALKAYWADPIHAPRPAALDAARLSAPPVPRTGPPSAGRNVGGGRLPSRGGSAADNELAPDLWRARGGLQYRTARR